jgi:hypothetical protein
MAVPPDARVSQALAVAFPKFQVEITNNFAAAEKFKSCNQRQRLDTANGVEVLPSAHLHKLGRL